MKALFWSALICLGLVGALRADPVIGFDDLPGDLLPVPAGYHELYWSNLDYVNGVSYSGNPSGFQAGVVSPNDVVGGGGSFGTSVIAGGLFDFLSAYATGLWNDNLQFEAKGYIHGTLVYDKTNFLSATKPTFINFNFYGVDRVELTSSGGTKHLGYSGTGAFFALDNVSVRTYVPYMPPFIANGGFETGDFTGWAHFDNTNSTWVTNTPAYVHTGTYGLQIGPTSIGSLSQNLPPTQIGTYYTLSFWLENQFGGANSFVAFWGGLPVVTLTNLPAFAWTNFQLNVLATRSDEFLEFQVFNSPSYFGLDDVSVTPAVLVSNGGFEAGDFSGWTQTGVTNFNSVIGAEARSGSFGARLGPTNALGFLSQPIITQPGQPYLLSLWLNSPDGETPNEFTALLNGQTLTDDVNLGAIGWTNLHFTVLSAETNSTLQLGVRDDPLFLGLDEISVVPVPLLQNGSFEFGDFTGWTLSGNTAGCSVTASGPYVNDGIFGARMGPSGSLGYLSQTIPTIPGQAYVINLSLYSPTNMGDAPVTEFSISWNGAALLDTTNLLGSGLFFFEYLVTADDTNSTLQLGFRDDPSYLGVDGVSVSPVAAPVIESIVKTNNSMDLIWTGWPGYSYVPQYTTNLSQPNWKQLEGLFYYPIIPAKTTDTNPPDPQRFYRIHMLPPPLS